MKKSIDRKKTLRLGATTTIRDLTAGDLKPLAGASGATCGLSCWPYQTFEDTSCIA